MSVVMGSAADYAGLFVDGSQEAAYVAKVLALNPTAYWIQGEHEGSTAICQINRNQNGTYTAVALGNAGIGDGQVCPFYNGVSSYTDVYSAALAAAFNGAEGTVAVWPKVNAAGVWTDGLFRQVIQLAVDGNNYVNIRKTNTNNQMQWLRSGGGTVEVVNLATGAPTGFFHAAMSWSESADEVKAFYNGVQTGATQSGLGAWAGNLSSNDCLVGVTTKAPTNPWSGFLAQCALWDSVLTPAQILSLATV